MPSDNSVFMVPNFLVLRYLLVKKYQFDLKKSYRSSIWRKFILKPLPIDNPPNPLRIDRYENTACLSVLLPDIPSHCHNDIILCARILLCNVSDTKNNRIIILTARVGVRMPPTVGGHCWFCFQGIVSLDWQLQSHVTALIHHSTNQHLGSKTTPFLSV